MGEDIVKRDKVKQDIEKMEKDHEAYVELGKAKGKYLWQGSMTPEMANQVAAICIHYGLDPFMKHIQLLGGNIYTSVPGLFYKANNLGIIKSLVPYALTKKEREDILPPIPEDTHAFKAVLETVNGGTFIEYGFASPKDVTETVRNKGYHAMSAMARTRAYGRVLRNALRINLPIYEEMVGNDLVSIGTDKQIVDGTKIFGDIETIIEPDEIKHNDIPESQDVPVGEEPHKNGDGNGNGQTRNRRSYPDLIKDWLAKNVKEADSKEFIKWIKSTVMNIALEVEPSVGDYRFAWDYLKKHKDSYDLFVKTKVTKPEEVKPAEIPKSNMSPDARLGYTQEIFSLLKELVGTDIPKANAMILNVTDNKHVNVRDIPDEEMKSVIDKLRIRKDEIEQAKKEK